MTTNDGAQDPQVSRADIEPAEIETLLPWYAVGTLRHRDRQRVEDALRNDADLARHAELVREELAETICLNESLGAPSARVMDRLMAAIDAETLANRKHSPVRALAGRFAAFIAGFSPRTLAVAASVATLAIALQAFFLVDMLATTQDPSQTAGLGAESNAHGTFAMVRFARQASAAEITKFLESYQASLVDGPEDGGVYRVRIAMTKLAKDELARIVQRMKRDRIVDTAEPGK